MLPQLALDEKALSGLDNKRLQMLKQANGIIFKKCEIAMLENGVTQEQLNEPLKILKLFGV